MSVALAIMTGRRHRARGDTYDIERQRRAVADWTVRSYLPPRTDMDSGPVGGSRTGRVPYDGAGRPLQAVELQGRCDVQRAGGFGVSPRVCSFDVFDTMITRAVGDPTDLWPIVASRLRSDGVTAAAPAAWSAVRRQSEERFGRLLGAPPTLQEIHQRIATRLDYDATQAAKAAAVEMEVERELSRPLAGAQRLLSAARAWSDAGRIVFVSDTPLPSTMVIELLDRAGLWREGDSCFASCEHRADKRDGRLFDVVAGTLGVDAADIVHVGDNRLSDVARARQAGWRATWRRIGRLNRYERLLSSVGTSTDGVSSHLAAASRLARTSALERGIDPAAARVAAGVLTPMLVGFVAWVLRRACTDGLERLYFLARDCEVVFDVARRIKPFVAPEVELRYLYSSRRAWYVPDVAPAQGAGGPSSALDHEEDEARQALVVDYLEQEGLADGVSSGMVDIGFRGTSSVYLETLLARRGHEPPKGYYYLGLHAEAGDVSRATIGDRQHGWLFDQLRGTGADGSMHGIISLLETFCAGTHGSVIGYRREGQRITPRLATPANQIYLEWGLLDVRAVVAETVDRMLDITDAIPPVDLAVPAWRLLGLFWQQPRRDEVQWWGRAPFEVDNDGRGAPIGERVTVRSAVARSRWHGGLQLRHRQSWLAGSARSSPYPMRAVLQSILLWRMYGDRLRRVPGRIRWELTARLGRDLEL